MSKRELIRKYRMSDARLAQLSDSIRNSAARDAADLTAYGINTASLTAIDTARTIFANTITDEELTADMMIATENKKAVQTDLLRQIRQIADRARIRYGEGSARYRRFGVEQLTKQTDGEQVRTGRRVVRAATDYLTELTEEGVTPAMIAELESTTSAFDILIDEQDESVKQRDIAVEERILSGNNLYALLSVLSARGKLCWGDTNEARYNDYLLTESTTDKNQAADGPAPAETVVNISATGITPTTIFTLTNTGSVPLNFYFARNPTDNMGEKFITVPSGETQTQTAMALGYNSETGFKRLNVFNEGKKAGGYAVEWV